MENDLNIRNQHDKPCKSIDSPSNDQSIEIHDQNLEQTSSELEPSSLSISNNHSSLQKCEDQDESVEKL